jgi:hypothetical protein
VDCTDALEIYTVKGVLFPLSRSANKQRVFFAWLIIKYRIQKNREEDMMKKTGLFIALGLLMVSMASVCSRAVQGERGVCHYRACSMAGEPERNTVKMIENR